MLLTDAMVSAHQPGLEIGECDMDRRKVGVSFGAIAIERYRLMGVAQARQISVPAPSVRAHHRFHHDVLLHEPRQRRAFPVSHDTQPQSASVVRVSVLSPGRVHRPLADLDCPCHQGFVVDSASFAAGATADQSLVNLDWPLGSNGVAVGADHAGAQFVQDLKGGLIARQPKLTLELHGRHPRRLRRHQVGTPEPSRQGHATAVHGRPSGQRDIGLAMPAAQNNGLALGETVGRVDGAALRAGEPIRPAKVFKVARASCVIGKRPLKFRDRSREAELVDAASTVEDLEDQLEFVRAEGYKAKSELKKAVQEVEALRKRSADLERDLAVSQEKSSKEHEQRKAAEASLDELHGRNADLKSDKDDLRQERDGLKKEFTMLKKRLESVETERDTLEKVKTESQARLSAQTERTETALKQIEKIQTERDEARASQSDVKAQALEFEIQATHYKEQLEQLMERFSITD